LFAGDILQGVTVAKKNWRAGTPALLGRQIAGGRREKTLGGINK
jgi:hypothetical protein